MKCLACDNQTKKSDRKYCSRSCLMRDRVLGQIPWNYSGHFKEQKYRKQHIPKSRWPRTTAEERHCIICGILIARGRITESVGQHNRRKYCSRACFGRHARGLEVVARL
jgi:hypothetical protein